MTPLNYPNAWIHRLSNGVTSITPTSLEYRDANVYTKEVSKSLIQTIKLTHSQRIYVKIKSTLSAHGDQ